MRCLRAMCVVAVACAAYATYYVPKSAPAVRNPYGVRADKLGIAISFTEGSGVPADIGVRRWDDRVTWGTTVVSGTGDGPDWVAGDGGGMQFVRTNNDKLVLWSALGDAVTLPRATMMFVFTPDVAAQTGYIFSTGGGTITATDNSLSVYNANGQVQVRHQTAGASSPYCYGTLTQGAKTVLIIRKTPSGLEAWMDDTPLTAVNNAATDASSIVLAASTSACIGNRGPGLSAVATDITVYAFCWWDWSLSDDELNDLRSDVYQNLRPEVPSGYVDTSSGPICTCVTGTTADLSIVTSTSMTGSIYVRAVYDTDAVVGDPGADPAQASVTAVTTANVVDAKALVQITGLTAGTTYYYLMQWSVDEVTWYNFPCGRGRFVTQRATGAYSAGLISDGHWTVTADTLTDLVAGRLGYGSDCMRLIAPADIEGTLSDRVDDDEGTITLAAGHGIVDGDAIWVGWESGETEVLAYATVGEVAGNDVPISGCTETLPAEDTVVWVGLDRDYMAGSTGLACYKVWRLTQDLVRQNADWVYDGGDSVLSEQPLGSNRNQFIAYRRLMTPLLTKAGCLFSADGNHDGAESYQHQVCAGQYRVQGEVTDLRKKFVPRPTNSTYAEGGENEGAPADPVDDLTPYDPGVSWIEPQESGAATYMSTYIYPFSEAANHSARLGLNKSPLENYYGFRWGGMTFAVLDPYRYTGVGQNWGANGGSAERGAPYVLGTAQKAWLQNVLTASTAPFKAVLLHQPLGGSQKLGQTGLLWYGDGSGIECFASRVRQWATAHWSNDEHALDAIAGAGVTEELWLHNLLRATHATLRCCGHLHCSGHVVSETVNYVTIGGNYGKAGDVQTVFGSLYTQGGAIGSSPAVAGVYFETGRTYTLLTVGDTVTVTVREVGLQADALFDGYSAPNYYCGEPITALQGATTVTLSSTPTEVAVVCDSSDGAFAVDGAETVIAGAGYAAANHYAAEFEGLGITYYDQPYTSGAITFTEVDGSVRVRYAPRTLYSAVLSNATSPATPKSSIVVPVAVVGSVAVPIVVSAWVILRHRR